MTTRLDRRPIAPHVQAALSAVQRRTSAAMPHAISLPRQGGLAPHVRAAVQMKPHAPVPAVTVVQRSAERNEYSVSKKKRLFHDKFEQSHLRNAQNYLTKSDMAYVGVEKYKKRSVGKNTIIFMTPYEEQVFLEQKHTYMGQDWEWTGYDIFESTTQFPAVDVSSSGSIKVYSAAKFLYSAYYDEVQGCYVVEHMKGISSGSVMS